MNGSNNQQLMQARRLAYWTPIYEACRMHEFGLTLDEFLSAPWYHLTRHGQETAFMQMDKGLRPLLPRQARIARKIRDMDLRNHRRRILAFRKKRSR